MARKLQTTLTAKDKTGAAFASLNRSIGGIRKGMATLGVGVAGFGALLIAATKNAIDLADSIDKTSNATGVGVESLQRWRFVATQAGGSVEKLDKALLKLNKNIGEAKQNTGSMVTIIKRYDEELYRNLLTVQNTDEAIGLLVDAMRDANTEQDAAAIGAAAFGREYKTFANITKMTAREVNDLKNSLKNVVSKEAVDRGVMLADAMDKLNTEFKAGLANAILENADALEDLARTAGMALPGLITGFLELGKSFGFIDKTELERAEEQLAAVESRMERIGWIVSLIGEEKTNWFPVQEMIVLRATAEDLRNTIKELNDEGPLEVVVGLDATGRLLRDAAQEYERMFGADSPYAKMMADQADLDKARALAQEERRRALLEEAEAFQMAHDPAFAYARAQAEINTLVKEFPHLAALGAKALADMKTESVLAADTMQGAMARAFQDIDYRMAQVDIFAGDMFGGMKNAAKSAVNEIISEFYRLVVIKPLMDMLFGGGSGGLLGGLFSGLFGGGKAKGGHVSGGTAYLVGEEGPEIFRPNTSGDIVPNNKLAMARSGGDSGVTVVQNIRFDVGLESVDQRIEQATPRIANESARAVRDAQQRSGGEYI